MISFHDLYQNYAPDVYRFAYWLSGNTTDAEDLTSETFVRAWTAADNLRVQTVKAYLFTITRHLYLQSRKRAERHTDISPELEDRSPSPQQVAEAHNELDAVMGVLRTLPELDHSVLIMRAQDGLSYEEIARTSGISVAAAKVKVHRARLKLARLRSPGENT
jgi:RNA polymerase sigma factor (sigma-70 family)